MDGSLSAKGNDLAITGGDDAVITTSRDNLVLSWSSGAAKLTGYRAHEVIGKNIAFLFPDKHREVDALNVSDVLAGAVVRNSVVKALSRNGDYVSIIYTLAPIADAEGRVVGVLRICKDISAFRAARLALEKALIQLKRVDEVRDDILSAVSDRRGLKSSFRPGLVPPAADEENKRSQLEFYRILREECESLQALLGMIQSEIDQQSA